MILLVVALLAAGVRWIIIGRELVRLDDPDGYLMLARALVRGEGLRINGRLTAYRPPLYPILLAPWVWACDAPRLPAALTAFHLGLGALTVVLITDSARRWGLSRSSAWVAAAITAFDPVLVILSRSLMTETMAALLVAATLWGISFRGWFGACLGGVGFGLASLCRPSLLPAAALTALAELVLGPGAWRDRSRQSLLLLASTFAVMSPWAIRNSLVLGKSIWTTTHGGYTLALANNQAYFGDVLDGPPGAVWTGANQYAWIDSINIETAGMTEPQADSFLRRQAIDFARENPLDFLRATQARLGRFWGVMPSASVYPDLLRWVTAVWTIPIWILLAIGLSNRSVWQWPRVAALSLIVALTVVHAVYWTDLRMRAPLVPAIALIAAVGWSFSGQCWSWRWIRR